MQKLKFINGNGVEIDLTDMVNFGIIAWEGFSADGLNIQSQQVPFQDGSVFLDALMEQRELSVTVAINAKGDLEKRYRLRRELISVLNPKLGEGVLIYTDNYLSKQIHVIPQIPLFDTNNSNDSGTPKVSCSFTACNPYWEDLEETVIEIDNNSLVDVENTGDVPAQIKVNISVEDNIILVENLTTEKRIETIENMSGNIKIDTNIGHKNVMKLQNDYDIIQGEDFRDGVVFGNYVILCGSSICKYDIFKNSTENQNNNLTHWMVSITYSPTLNLFAGICLVDLDTDQYSLYISNDLKNWTEISTGYALDDLISWEDSMFKIKLKNSSTTYLKSVNGTTWSVESGTIKKNKINALYKNKYYRIPNYANIIQKSDDGLTWQNDFTATQYISLFFTPVYDKLYAFGSCGTVIVKDNNEDWQLLRGNKFYESFKKSCVFKNKIYFISSNRYLLSYQNGVTDIVLDENGTMTDIVSFNNKLFISAFRGGRTIIYSSSDGVSFNTNQIELESLDIGDRFFIDKTHNELYINLSYSVFKYNSINNNWNEIESFYDWRNSEEDGSYFTITEYKGNFYIGKVRGYTTQNNKIIYKTADFINYSVAYQDSNLQNQDVCYGCYADDEKLIFCGYAGLILYSENGNSFNKKCPQNTNSLERINKIDNVYYIFGTEWNEYLTTEDFINFITKNNPQHGAVTLFFINKYQNNLYYCGMLYPNGFFGGDIKETEENIIDKISANSDMGLNVTLGHNVFVVKGSENTKAILSFRQKYIGV